MKKLIVGICAALLGFMSATALAEESRGWTLDTSAKTITECNASDTAWVFNVDISENNLTLKAPATVGTSTVLDFRKVIATTEGVQYQIVTSANSALAGKTTMTELYLPESMTTVSHDFCKNCTGLTKVQLGSKVQFIGNNAFYNCSSLTTVTPFLPDTLTSLGSHAFYCCLKLTGDLVIGQSGSVTAGDSAAGMFTFSQITSMTIKNMATIPYAFAAALPALTSVSIDDATTTFAARVFYQCSVLTELTLPPNLTSMGAECFSYCPVLKRVTRVVEDGQPALTWSSNTFSTWNDYQCAFVIHRDQTTWNGAKLSDVMTPWKDLDAATQAKYTEAYPGEHEPRGVIIDSGNPRRQWVVVAKIEVTPGVKNLVINGEPEKFGASSVSPSYGIQKNISVPMDVSAPRYAPNEAGSTLYECTGYSLETSGDYEWGTPVTNLLSGTEATRTVNYTTDTDGDKRLSWLWTPAAYMVTIVQPTDPAIGSVEISQGSVEGYFKIGETATVTAVNGTGAFVKWHGDVPAGHETDNPLSLEIKGPTTLTPEFVMPWTWNASAGTITDGYWVLRATRSNDGKYTIYGMTTADPLGVLDLTKPMADGGAITKVEDWTFRLNTSIVELRLPETLSIIGKYAFASCHNLKKVTPFLPSGVTYIGEGAFWDSTALESELFLAKDGGDITFSSHSHFRETAIPKVTFGPDITAVGWASFLYCTKLAEVHLNEKITKIERDAFNGCTALETVEPFLPASVTKVDILAFCNCAKLKSPLVLETKKVQGVRPTIDLATSSESAHFWGCAMIPSITLGEVSTLRGRVFGSMTSVKDFYIKKKTPFEVSGSQNFKSWTARQSRWFIPKTGWESWLETNVTPWADVSDADKEAYSAAFPDGKKPCGMVKSGYQSLSGAQWAILWNPESSGFSLILR